MSRQRCWITGEIEVLTPLHVGSGTFREIAVVKGKEGSNEPKPGVAAIVRDFEDRPFIPGTAVKGLLLRLAARLGNDARRAHLFGAAKKDGGGNMGAAIVRGLVWTSPGNTQNLPYAAGCAAAANDTAKGLGPGVFVSARTAINRQTGTAEENKLFFQEMVAPGARLALQILVEDRSEPGSGMASGSLEADVAAIRAVLKQLEHSNGQAIGKNETDGLGRIRLVKSPALKFERLGESGDFEPFTPKLAPLANFDATPQPVWSRRLKLVCEGPFLIVDSSYTESGRDVPQNVGQRTALDLPLLLGSSLSGALRARARWLAALDESRAGRNPENVDRPDKIVRKLEDAQDLTPVERLFGVTGFRGLLQIDEIKIEKAAEFCISSVKLDRFTGGPMDNALFKTRAHRDVHVAVVLRLADHVRSKVPATQMSELEEDKALLDKLLKDICKDGLVLGHGGSKGFGWFKVAVEGAKP